MNSRSTKNHYILELKSAWGEREFALIFKDLNGPRVRGRTEASVPSSVRRRLLLMSWWRSKVLLLLLLLLWRSSLSAYRLLLRLLYLLYRSFSFVVVAVVRRVSYRRLPSSTHALNLLSETSASLTIRHL